MAVSIFDLFKIGIGPSSSHTVGPMKAARRYLKRLQRNDQLEHTARITVTLYGSLALTGRGHGTDKALLLGLMGEEPDRVDPDRIEARLEAVRANRRLTLAGLKDIDFSELEDLRFRMRQRLPRHPNGMRFRAYDARRALLDQRDYYSVGGGFVMVPAMIYLLGMSEIGRATCRERV
mgnify:CR=1 FL=1